MKTYHDRFSLSSNNASDHVASDEVLGQTSDEVREFWNKMLMVVKTVVLKRFNDNKQQMLIYMINDMSMDEMASILSKSYINVNKHYHRLIKIIQSELCWSEEFINLVSNSCPQILKGRMLDWIKEEQQNHPKIKCPVCGKVYHNHIAFKNHLITVKYRSTKNDQNDRNHIQFIKDQEAVIRESLKKYGKFEERWVNKLVARDDFYLGYIWVYKFCNRVNKKN